MSKKSIKNEIESLYGIVILGFIGVVFKFISILFSSILSGINFFFFPYFNTSHCNNISHCNRNCFMFFIFSNI